MSLLARVGLGKREVRGVTRGTRERVESGTKVVVVGGGIAGVAAACVLAERGVRVTLLELEPHLGGRCGAWTERLPDGTPFQMERGFHAFFRHYYNLRGLLTRVDPDLERLEALDDYPIASGDGAIESFGDLPKAPPFNLMTLLRRTELVTFKDLRDVDQTQARLLLGFDPVRTYAEHDGASAREYLASLNFPQRAKEVLFHVFSHAFFHPEERMSAAEMLMMFHFYFLGNPEGLVFDVLDEPSSDALWKPMERYLSAQGVELRLGCGAEVVKRMDKGNRWRVCARGGVHYDGDGLVLATNVRGLQTLFASSPDLAVDAGLDRSVSDLGVTLPYAVWRVFFDRRANDDRHAFVRTMGMGLLHSISLYERFEGESRRWSLRTGGSVIELHAYAVPHENRDVIQRDLLAGLRALYPELADARILHDCFLLSHDCPAFAPGSHGARPRVPTPYGNVVLAGDFVKLPFPTALMERAATSGILAANHLLDRWDVRGEALYSIAPRGFMASLR